MSEPGKKVPFRITYLNKDAGGLGWYARVDIPGTLSNVVKQQGKFPYLLDDKGNWKSRDDVYYKGVVTATADKWLSPGCGAGEKSPKNQDFHYNQNAETYMLVGEVLEKGMLELFEKK